MADDEFRLTRQTGYDDIMIPLRGLIPDNPLILDAIDKNGIPLIHAMAIHRVVTRLRENFGLTALSVITRSFNNSIHYTDDDSARKFITEALYTTKNPTTGKPITAKLKSSICPLTYGLLVPHPLLGKLVDSKFQGKIQLPIELKSKGITVKPVTLSGDQVARAIASGDIKILADGTLEPTKQPHTGHRIVFRLNPVSTDAAHDAAACPEGWDTTVLGTYHSSHQYHLEFRDANEDSSFEPVEACYEGNKLIGPDIDLMAITVDKAEVYTDDPKLRRRHAVRNTTELDDRKKLILAVNELIEDLNAQRQPDTTPLTINLTENDISGYGFISAYELLIITLINQELGPDLKLIRHGCESGNPGKGTAIDGTLLVFDENIMGYAAIGEEHQIFTDYLMRCDDDIDPDYGQRTFSRHRDWDPQMGLDYNKGVRFLSTTTSAHVTGAQERAKTLEPSASAPAAAGGAGTAEVLTTYPGTVLFGGDTSSSDISPLQPLLVSGIAPDANAEETPPPPEARRAWEDPEENTATSCCTPSCPIL